MDMNGLRQMELFPTQTAGIMPNVGQSPAAMMGMTEDQYAAHLVNRAANAKVVVPNAGVQAFMNPTAPPVGSPTPAAVPQPSSLRNIEATVKRALNPSVLKNVAEAKGVTGKLAAVGTGAAGKLTGLASKALGPVAVGYEVLNAVQPAKEGHWRNYLDENGNIQEGAISRGINAAVMGASIPFAEVGAPLAAGALVAANPWEKVLLSDEDEARYNQMQLDNEAARSQTLQEYQQQEAAAQAAAAAAQAAPAPQQGLATKPMTAVDMIAESLRRADEGSNPVQYRETPEQAALVQQSANPNEQYEAFAPTISPELMAERQRLIDARNEVESRPRNTLKFADGLLGVPRYNPNEVARLNQAISAIDQSVTQRQGQAQQDLQNRRTMHGFDKRNRIDLHVADQAADIDAAQLKETIRGNNISRASAAATLMRDITKADLDRQAANYEIVKNHFTSMVPEDAPGEAAALIDNFFVTQRRAGVDPTQLAPSQLMALLAQHNQGMQNYEAAQAAAPMWSNTPVTPYDAEFVQSGTPVRPFTNMFHEFFNNNVGLGTGLRQELKDIFGDPQMVDLRGGASIPLQDSSGTSRVQYASMLQQMASNPNMPKGLRDQAAAQISLLMNK